MAYTARRKRFRFPQVSGGVCGLVDAGMPRMRKEFFHSEVSSNSSLFDPFAGAAVKPEFPNGGQSVPCPYCGQPSIYQRHQLIYRA